MKSCIYFFALLFIVIANSSFAQTDKTIDSLQQIIKTSKQDTLIIKAYMAWGEYIYLSQPDSALVLWQKTKNIIDNILLSEKTVNPDLKLAARKYLSVLLGNIGLIYDSKSDFTTAMEYYMKGLKIQEEIGDKKGIANSYNSIGTLYFYQGDISKVMEYFMQSIKIREEIGDKAGLAESLVNMGYIYKNQGDIKKALEYYYKSLQVQVEEGNKHTIAASMNNIGAILLTQGDTAKALKFFIDGLHLREEIDDKAGIANSYMNIGTYYEFQGNIPKALDYYLKSLKINQEIGDKKAAGGSLNNIGIIYYGQGNLTKSLEYFQKSLTIFDAIGDRSSVTNLLINNGSIYEELGDIPKALEYYQKCLINYEELGEKYGLANTLSNIGVLYNKSAANKDTLAKALLLHQRSLKIRDEIEDQQGIVISTGNIGYSFLLQNDLRNAKDYSEKAYKYAKVLGFPINIKGCANQLLRVYKKTKNYAEAEPYALEVVGYDNKALMLNFSILTEKEQELYFKTIAADFMNFNSYALVRKNENPSIVEHVYNNTIKNKGLLLKSSTAMRNAILNSKDTVLIAKYNHWITLNKEIFKQISEGKDVKETEKQAHEIEKELVKGSQFFNDFSKIQNLSWKDIKKNLKKNEAALEFISFEENSDTIIYCALLIKADSKFPQMIKLFVEKDLELILGINNRNNISYIKSVYGTRQSTNERLYKLIWQPLEQYLNGIQKVFYSPDGLLHKISFSTIGKGKDLFLCDNFSLHRMGSTGKIAMPESITFDKNMTAGIFGGIEYSVDILDKMVWQYLPGTKTEADKIEQIFKSKKIDLFYKSGKNAGEKELKETAGKCNILHIATHGFFYPDPNEIRMAREKEMEDLQLASRGGARGFGVGQFMLNKNPLMRSGLVFAGANYVWNSEFSNDGEDGVLTAQEVTQLNMQKTQLVVMSACETGLGDIRGSEGVYGLQRAFKMAGVKFLIMSLWQVPDKETSEFMTVFYEKLLVNKDIRRSFTETQTEMRKKYDPFFWAAFVLIE